MKNKALIISLLSAFTTQIHAKKWVVDTILARVNGVNILKSDLERPQINKEEGTALSELIGEELLLQHAQEKKLLPTQADLDRQIFSLKLRMGLDGEDQAGFEEQLKQFGFTLIQYKKQLSRALAIEKAKQAEFSERVLITSRDVEEHHKHHPIEQQEQFHLHMLVLQPEEVDSYEEVITDNTAEWKDFGFIPADEIDERYEAGTRLKVGEVSKPLSVGSKKVLLKLVAKKEKKLLTLDECYGDIERTLQQKKREEFAREFQEDLIAKAFVFFP